MLRLVSLIDVLSDLSSTLIERESELIAVRSRNQYLEERMKTLESLVLGAITEKDAIIAKQKEKLQRVEQLYYEQVEHYRMEIQNLRKASRQAKYHIVKPGSPEMVTSYLLTMGLIAVSF